MKLTTSNLPAIGDGATICYWSDRQAATVIRVSLHGGKIVLQADEAIRTDNHGMSEVQEYTYQPDPAGEIYHGTLRKDGQYRLTGTNQLIRLGVRNQYHDFSF